MANVYINDTENKELEELKKFLEMSPDLDKYKQLVINLLYKRSKKARRIK